MDLYDRDTLAEEQHRADALAEQAAKMKAAGDWRKLSAKRCVRGGCGARIPDERRRAVPGVEFCADCQTAIEEKERRGR